MLVALLFASSTAMRESFSEEDDDVTTFNSDNSDEAEASSLMEAETKEHPGFSWRLMSKPEVASMSKTLNWQPQEQGTEVFEVFRYTQDTEHLTLANANAASLAGLVQWLTLNTHADADHGLPGYLSRYIVEVKRFDGQPLHTPKPSTSWSDYMGFSKGHREDVADIGLVKLLGGSNSYPDVGFGLSRGSFASGKWTTSMFTGGWYSFPWERQCKDSEAFGNRINFDGRPPVECTWKSQRLETVPTSCLFSKGTEALRNLLDLHGFSFLTFYDHWGEDRESLAKIEAPVPQGGSQTFKVLTESFKARRNGMSESQEEIALKKTVQEARGLSNWEADERQHSHHGLEEEAQVKMAETALTNIKNAWANAREEMPAEILRDVVLPLTEKVQNLKRKLNAPGILNDIRLEFKFMSSKDGKVHGQPECQRI